MAATTATSAIPNPPVLNEHNYEDWSFRVKLYLLAEDLWDVVEATTEPPKPEDGEADFKAWRKKDAKALILIQNYCGSANYSLIWGTETSKAAWDTLAEKLNPAQEELFPLVPREDLNINPTSNDGNESNTGYFNEFSLHQPFIDNVSKGDWDLAKEYLSRNPEAIRERGSIYGLTALHVAVALENVNMGKALVEFMTEEDLEIQDGNGLTAITHAVSRGITQLAKCIVEKNKKLLSLPSPPDNVIPLVRAYCVGHWELARYLYSVTPLEALLQDDGCGGSEIVSESFRAAKLGIHVRPHSAVYDICINVENVEDGPISERDLMVRSGMGILRGLVPNPRKLFGINHIYKMKWTHERTSEILHSMCKVIEGKNVKQL